MDTRRLAGIAAVAPLSFVLAVIVTASMRPDYSHYSSFISELGETGGPNSWLMNWLGFKLMAVGVLAFAVRFMGSDLPTTVRVGLGLVALFAIGLFAAGWYSCDPGCTPEHPTRNQVLHDLSSLCLPLLTVTCFYFAALKWSRWRFAGFSLATGVLCSICAVLLVDSIPAREATGVFQRILIGSLWIWLAVLAIKVGRWEAPASD